MFLVWIQALAFLLRVILHLACPFSFNPCTEKSSHLVVPTLLGKREKFIPRSADPRVWVLAHSPGCFPCILNRLGRECHRLSSWSNLAFGSASNHDRVKDLRFHKVAEGFHCLVIKEAEVGQLGWKMPHRDRYRPEKKWAGPWTKWKRGISRKTTLLDKGSGPQNSEWEPWLSYTWAGKEKTEGLWDGADFLFVCLVSITIMWRQKSRNGSPYWLWKQSHWPILTRGKLTTDWTGGWKAMSSRCWRCIS